MSINPGRSVAPDINVDLTLRPVDQAVFFTTWSSYDYDMVWFSQNEPFNDPSVNLHFQAQGKEGGSDSGFSGYSNPRINALIRAGEAALDLKTRTKIYDQLQKIFMAEMPQILLVHPDYLYARRSNVRGYRVPPTTIPDYVHAWKSS